MPTYERPHVEEVVRLLTRDAKPLIVAVTGPRQTGKTTIIRDCLERVDMPGRYVAVDEIRTDPGRRWDRDSGAGGRAWLHDAWLDARREAEASERGFVLALDEIQHVDMWSLIAKAQWDRDRRTGCPLRVIVAGSAPWSMMTGLHESLAGRFMPVKVTHWSFTEMAAAFGFGLDEYLFFGGYPGVTEEIGDVEAWRTAVQRTIVSPAIERDIIGLTRIEKPALMRRLMELAADYSGQILSYNKMLGQLQEAGNATTLAEYLDLLSNAGLVTGLSKFSGARYAARGSSPKLNVLNTALMTVPLRRSFEEVRADRTLWGRIIESAVGAHLRNTAGLAVDLHHWREGPHEVDFVLSRGPGPVGIEVKSGAGAGRRRGLAAFRERFSGARALLVGDRGIPLAEFLSRPAVYWADYDGPFARDDTRTRIATAEAEDDEMSSDGSGGDAVRESAPKYAGKARTLTWTQPLVPGRRKSGDPVAEAEQRKFMADAREQADALERGMGSPWLWERIGEAYLCAIPGHFGDEPVDCLRVRVESDEQLLAAALRGLPRFVRRDDLPPLAEIVRLDGTRGGDRYCYPVLASLARTVDLGGDPLSGLDDEGVRQTVGSWYLANHVHEPSWYRRAAHRRPNLCAEALVTVYKSLIRGGREHNRHLFDLSDDDANAEVARLSVPALLGVLPTRCTKPQVSALHALLWAGLLFLPGERLEERIRRRSAALGMDAAQRALWLAAGLFISAKEYRSEAVTFLRTGREPRAHHMLNFLMPERPRRRDLPEPWDDWDAPDIAALFKVFGRWFDPWGGERGCRYELTTTGLRADWLLRRWIGILAERGPEGREALGSLARSPVLDRWYEKVSAASPSAARSTGTASASPASPPDTRPPCPPARTPPPAPRTSPTRPR